MVKNKRSISPLLSLLTIFMLLALPSTSDAVTNEYRLKAAFLVQFVKYTRWPAPAIKGDQIIIGIIGEDLVAGAFGNYKGKRLQGKYLRFKKVDSISEAKTCCHLIFISVSEQARMDDVINALAGKPILTVSEIDNFTQRGGMIHLRRMGFHQKFSVNINNAIKANLDFSSQMLKVAYAIEE